MNTKKFLSCLLASAMMCGVLVSCGDSDDSSKSSESKQTTTEAATEAETTKAETDEQDATSEPQAVAVDDTEFEEAVEPESGDAYLAIADSQWWIQYMGTKEGQLTYDAGVVPITGDGEYTVSVNGATAGLLYDVTGDANGDYTPSGMSFMAVMVKDGTTLYPNMAIEITSIKMNGEEVPMTKKNYTSSDDGVEMRANIYNEWVNELPEDAHDANGAVTDASAYSAQIVDKDAFNSGWTSIEVTFNVTGTGK